MHFTKAAMYSVKTPSQPPSLLLIGPSAATFICLYKSDTEVKPYMQACDILPASIRNSASQELRLQKLWKQTLRSLWWKDVY